MMVSPHAHHLGDVGDAARTVAQTRGLDDDVDRGADHLADGVRDGSEKPPIVIIDLQRDRLRADCWRACSHRAVVARVHGLQQVERLGSADFADDDASGRIRRQLRTSSRIDLAFAFDVGRTGFQRTTWGCCN